MPEYKNIWIYPDNFTFVTINIYGKNRN